MAGIRPEVRMDPGEVRAFLESHHTLLLATVDSDGAPHVAPVFYALLDDRTLAFLSASNARRVRNLHHEPRVSGVIEDGDSYATIRAVQFTGRARFDDGPDAQRIAEHLARRRSSQPLPEGIENWIPPGRVVVVIDLDRVVSWDHRKR